MQGAHWHVQACINTPVPALKLKLEIKNVLLVLRVVPSFYCGISAAFIIQASPSHSTHSIWGAGRGAGGVRELALIPGLAIVPRCYPALWLGWACLTKKVHGPWHQGVCFDLPMIFCA